MGPDEGERTAPTPAPGPTPDAEPAEAVEADEAVEPAAGDPPDLAGPAGDTLLRPALEVAFEAIRLATEGNPPVPSPRALQPFLRFKKLPPKALGIVRAAVEQSPDIRSRLAEAVTEDDVGRAGWLWLARPPGWEGELGALVDEVDRASQERGAVAGERKAARRAASAEAARDRAVAERDQARTELDQLRAALAAERKGRRDAEERVDQLRRRAESLELERAAAQRRAEAATAEAEERDRTVARLELEIVRVRAELAHARALVDERTAHPEPAASEPQAASPAPTTAPVAVDDRTVDAVALGIAVARAAEAANALGAALVDASALLASPPTVEEVPEEASPAAPPPPARLRLARTERRPAPLPPAVFEDSREAAEHLIRLPGVTLVVDGYNASIQTWPDLPIAEQRRRLVDALGELSSRTGAAVEVVFDGADVGEEEARSGPRGVRIAFTTAGVEADDVVIERAGRLDLPVVVASNDRRVRSGARRGGANLLTIRQLLVLLRRG